MASRVHAREVLWLIADAASAASDAILSPIVLTSFTLGNIIALVRFGDPVSAIAAAVCCAANVAVIRRRC